MYIVDIYTYTDNVIRRVEARQPVSFLIYIVHLLLLSDPELSSVRRSNSSAKGIAKKNTKHVDSMLEVNEAEHQQP